MKNNLYNNLINPIKTNERSTPYEKNIKPKLDFNQKKKNTIKSLSEVENFLRNFKNFSNSIKLYKILK